MRSEELSLHSGALALPATLDLPEGPGPHGAIVPLHPAADASRAQFLFEHLARTVTNKLDFAVLRYDRRGDDVPLAVQADDAEAALALLRSRSDIDPSRVGLWGFSQGAWVAPLVASRSDAVRFLVLLGATGVSPAEQMRYGTEFHLRRAGYGDPEAQRLRAARLAVERFNRGDADPRERAGRGRRDRRRALVRARVPQGAAARGVGMVAGCGLRPGGRLRPRACAGASLLWGTGRVAADRRQRGRVAARAAAS